MCILIGSANIIPPLIVPSVMSGMFSRVSPTSRSGCLHMIAPKEELIAVLVDLGPSTSAHIDFGPC